MYCCPDVGVFVNETAAARRANIRCVEDQGLPRQEPDTALGRRCRGRLEGGTSGDKAQLELGHRRDECRPCKIRARHRRNLTLAWTPCRLHAALCLEPARGRPGSPMYCTSSTDERCETVEPWTCEAPGAKSKFPEPHVRLRHAWEQRGKLTEEELWRILEAATNLAGWGANWIVATGVLPAI